MKKVEVAQSIDPIAEIDIDVLTTIMRRWDNIPKSEFDRVRRLIMKYKELKLKKDAVL